MMHMSSGLGVNCTFCHNTRSFKEWDQSPPQRATAFHGIRLVRDVNTNYLAPIASVFPPHRLGPKGGVAKANCATCHQGLNKPLNGVSMLGDYPSLAAPNVLTREELLPGVLEAMPVEEAAATPAGGTATDAAPAAPAATATGEAATPPADPTPAAPAPDASGSSAAPAAAPAAPPA